MKDEKHPGGRPTKYDPSFCEKVIEFMRQGDSKEAVAGRLEIAKDTLYRWAKEHEEFSDAIKRGETLSQVFWEDMGKDMVLSGQGSASSWIFNMKNRFSWRDKSETEITGAAGGPVEMVIKVVKDQEQIDEMKGDGNRTGDKELPKAAGDI